MSGIGGPDLVRITLSVSEGTVLSRNPVPALTLGVIYALKLMF